MACYEGKARCALALVVPFYMVTVLVSGKIFTSSSRENNLVVLDSSLGSLNKQFGQLAARFRREFTASDVAASATDVDIAAAAVAAAHSRTWSSPGHDDDDDDDEGDDDDDDGDVGDGGGIGADGGGGVGATTASVDDDSAGGGGGGGHGGINNDNKQEQQAQQQQHHDNHNHHKQQHHHHHYHNKSSNNNHKNNNNSHYQNNHHHNNNNNNNNETASAVGPRATSSDTKDDRHRHHRRHNESTNNNNNNNNSNNDSNNNNNNSNNNDNHNKNDSHNNNNEKDVGGSPWQESVYLGKGKRTGEDVNPVPPPPPPPQSQPSSTSSSTSSSSSPPSSSSKTESKREEGNPSLITSYVNLPDWNHNEAIVHWSGNKSNVIFVLTRDHDPSGQVVESSLWQSKDYGGTFRRINFTENALIYYYFTSNVNHNKLIFTDVKNKQLFLTYNEAEHIIRVSIDFTPNRIVLHPSMEDWVLGYDLKAGKLYCSLNFGRNWTLLHNFVTPRFFWAVEGHDQSMAVVHMELLDSTGETRYLACLAPYCGEISMDMSINPILPSSLIVQDEYIFVQKQHFDRNELYVSYRRESFKKAHFPDDLQPQNFNILNTNEGQVFVAVHHEKDFVNCYLSESTGQFYVLTLPNIVAVTVKGRFQVDLYQVKGLPGIYLANQEPSQLNLKESGRRTYISFDKGGNWSLIPVPRDLRSQCKSDKLSKCSLHLHLQQMEVLFNVPRILSDENAPGLILAHGTIGEQLSFQDVSVFISRDVGVHWYSAPFHGLHELNILDQGSAITALNASWKTREIYFSCDEGQSWQKHIFADENVYVDGVLNEPGINTLIVSVYAHKFPSKGWILVKANFSSILTRRCSSEDYEGWNPAEEVSKGCILGRKLIFERKKQFSRCNNGRDYERPINSTVCQCSKQDFECDFGYERETKEDECIPARWYNPERPVFDCPENQYFNKSQGYRKVGGDYCVGGVSNQSKYKHILTKCPIIPPAGLQISTSKPIIATMSVIRFNLTQNEGSVLSTNYTIDFGDGTIQYFHGPDILSREMSHRYFSHGSYTVSVKAENANGSATTKCLVHAEDEIEEFNVESLNGVQTHHPASFHTAVSGRHMSTSNIGDVHYVWHFGDEKLRLPLLTWKKNVSHVYMEPGAYIATVEAINSVSSAYVQIPIHVYNYIRRIQLTFSSNIDHINRYDQQWRSWLKRRLQERLMDLLRVTSERLIVFVYNEIPPRSDVILLPINPQSVSDRDTDRLVENLLSLVKEKYIDIKWLDSVVKVTGASIHNEISISKSKSNILPIAIAAPILGLSVIFLAMVFLYYRRKFHRVQRYSFLQARDAADSLLEDDEDDPPLDPNPNFSHIEMTEDQADSVEGGGDLPNPVLVMMPGKRSQSSLTDSHALRC